ncbi:hypothetical protein KDK_35820 [Dictyobacter kobayashii]|uniref:Uncharacterized protein n=1 Tax=Dictyobacter kobayashii TaxID=2014872 RepID=A0A402AKY6_9CHLR|nr:hypothetical protein KDK_35820 [Dictyobacter kobayashii]
MQGLTTREPDDSMIECAIASLQRVLLRDTEKQVVEKVEPAVPSDLVTNV